MKFDLILSILFFFGAPLIHGAINTKHYVVYMGDHSHPNSDSVISANHEILASVTGSIDGAQQAAVHHYTKSFRGFSAMLTAEQARRLAESDSVVSVFDSTIYHVHTTNSWEFLGINSVQQYNQLGVDMKSDVIVGVIDTGVWPESESFTDKGLGPVPKRFKGKCVAGENFTESNCNRKLIGARFYSKGFEREVEPFESQNRTFFRSARDSDGHGTHTASTVAGSMVANVSLFGMASGTARGGAPSARLAIYKACWFNLCSSADLLAAFEDAIEDGVDIISLSVGPSSPQPSFFVDSISIGAFHAFRKGILVSASAGNSALPGTASNVAPWFLTVAASSLNRELYSFVHLGNSKVLKGYSLNPLKMRRPHPLVPASAAAASGVRSGRARFCMNNTLDPSLIKGMIVVCEVKNRTDNRMQKGLVIRKGGGVGMILIDAWRKEVSLQFVIPATVIGVKEAEELNAYLATEKNPTARIDPTLTDLNTRPAPKMGPFSSMGPNIITPDIIKPDITAPGLNILAAWPPLASVVTAGRSVEYNIVSGTSMSCPHVSAVAAIIKSRHPSWSASAIKSALMTTATVLDNTQGPILRYPNGSSTTPFDYGSGHLNPVAAVDPGLVYDFDSSGIIDFLCSHGASSAQLKNLTGKLLDCKNPPIPSYNLNYPSIGVTNMTGSVSVRRTVTYYGKGPTVYVASVESPAGVEVAVRPHNLRFRNAGEKMSFSIEFKPYKSSNGSFVFGALTWNNGIHRVRSPIGLHVSSCDIYCEKSE